MTVRKAKELVASQQIENMSLGLGLLSIWVLESKLVNSASTGPEKFVELSSGQIIESIVKNRCKVKKVAIEWLRLFTEERCQSCVI